MFFDVPSAKLRKSIRVNGDFLFRMSKENHIRGEIRLKHVILTESADLKLA